MFNIKKYPIKTEKGNKYLVKINTMIDDIKITYSFIEVDVYKKHWILNRCNTLLYTKRYYYDSHEFHDYILATKNTVKEYESSERYFAITNKYDIERKFENWNGNIE